MFVKENAHSDTFSHVVNRSQLCNGSYPYDNVLSNIKRDIRNLDESFADLTTFTLYSYFNVVFDLKDFYPSASTDLNETINMNIDVECTKIKNAIKNKLSRLITSDIYSTLDKVNYLVDFTVDVYPYFDFLSRQIKCTPNGKLMNSGEKQYLDRTIPNYTYVWTYRVQIKNSVTLTRI